MIRVLFVCLGNICRSPMAEAVFRHKVKEAGLENRIEVDSAGTGDWHIGHAPHEGTRKLLDNKRIPWEGMKARQVNGDDFRQFDYIVAMDDSNVSNLRRIGSAAGRASSGREPGGVSAPQVCRLLDLVPEQPLRDVPDPYYTGNFEEVYELVAAGCDALLERIKREKLA